MMDEKLRQDIEVLKDIHTEFEANYDDSEWDLCNFHKSELYRITGMEAHDLDESNLSHYITGMERELQLKEIYDEKDQ